MGKKTTFEFSISSEIDVTVLIYFIWHKSKSLVHSFYRVKFVLTDKTRVQTQCTTCSKLDLFHSVL